MKRCIKLSFVGIFLLLLCGCVVSRRTHLYNLTGEQISVHSPKRNQWTPINTGSDKTLCYEGKRELDILAQGKVFEINLIHEIVKSDPTFSLYSNFRDTLKEHGFIESRHTFYQTFTYHFVATNNLIYFRPVKETFWGERPVPLSDWDNIVSNQPPNFPLNLKSDEWRKKSSSEQVPVSKSD